MHVSNGSEHTALLVRHSCYTNRRGVEKLPNMINRSAAFITDLFSILEAGVVEGWEQDYFCAFFLAYMYYFVLTVFVKWKVSLQLIGLLFVNSCEWWPGFTWSIELIIT